MKYVGLTRDFKEGEYVRRGTRIFTKQDGRILTGSAYCHHRGFPLLSGDGATSCSNLLKCPYHGLLWKSEQSHTAGEFVSETGLISGPLEDASRSLGDEFHSESHIVKCSASMWLQNTMDPNHLKTVHKAGFGDLFEGRPYDVQIEPSFSSYRIAVSQEAKDSLARWAEPLSPDFYHLLVYPNLSITSFLGIFWSIETAVDVGGDLRACKVHTRYFVAKGVSLPPLLLKTASRANSVLLKEDRDICEKWDNGQPREPLEAWLPGEERIRAFLGTIGWQLIF